MTVSTPSRSSVSGKPASSGAVAAAPPTPRRELDAAVADLAAHAGEWAALPLAERIEMLRGLIDDFHAVCPRWVEATRRLEGIDRRRAVRGRGVAGRAVHRAAQHAPAPAQPRGRARPRQAGDRRPDPRARRRPGGGARLPGDAVGPHVLPAGHRRGVDAARRHPRGPRRHPGGGLRGRLRRRRAASPSSSAPATSPRSARWTRSTSCSPRSRWCSTSRTRCRTASDRSSRRRSPASSTAASCASSTAAATSAPTWSSTTASTRSTSPARTRPTRRSSSGRARRGGRARRRGGRGSPSG